MPGKVSPTLRVLLEMRDELRKLNERTDKVEVRVGTLETVITHEMTETRKVLQQVVTLLRDRHGAQLADHERRLQALEKRTG